MPAFVPCCKLLVTLAKCVELIEMKKYLFDNRKIV